MKYEIRMVWTKRRNEFYLHKASKNKQEFTWGLWVQEAINCDEWVWENWNRAGAKLNRCGAKLLGDYTW